MFLKQHRPVVHPLPSYTQTHTSIQRPVSDSNPMAIVPPGDPAGAGLQDMVAAVHFAGVFEEVQGPMLGGGIVPCFSISQVIQRIRCCVWLRLF